jgi:hypothetical protein
LGEGWGEGEQAALRFVPAYSQRLGDLQPDQAIAFYFCITSNTFSPDKYRLNGPHPIIKVPSLAIDQNRTNHHATIPQHSSSSVMIGFWKNHYLTHDS